MAFHWRSIEDTPIEKLAEMALQKPEYFGYWGDEDMFVTWGFTGHDRTRDSYILENANFKAISEELMEKFPDDFRIENYSHWACGWVDRLVCKILIHKDKRFVDENITEAFRAAIRIHEVLDDYPVYDENLYSEMQVEEIYSFMNDLPSPILDMVDQYDENWVAKIVEQLEIDGVYIDPDASIYPKDDEILEAIYRAEIWNPENIEDWEEWCDTNGFEYPPKKKNPNQLSLFGE
jgi:hypothetical protein